MPGLTTGQAADLINKAINKVWLKASEAETKEYEQYVGVQTGVTDYYFKDSSLSGLGYATRILENAVVTEQKPVQGFDQTYTQVNYGSFMSFSEAMWKFGIKKRDLENVTQEAFSACSDLREQLFAERLENAFATSYTHSDEGGNFSIATTGGDSAALITNSHTREDGGTAVNNRITDGTTVNLPLDYAGLKAARRTATLIKNPRGKPAKIKLDTLLVADGSANHMKAEEMLYAISKGKMPETFDNDGTGVTKYQIVPVTHWVNNLGYWYMIDSRKKNSKYGSLMYFEAQPIERKGPNVVFKTGEIQYKATMWFAYGHNEYRNIVGSKATSAA